MEKNLKNFGLKKSGMLLSVSQKQKAAIYADPRPLTESEIKWLKRQRGTVVAAYRKKHEAA